jgi:hypothetical protein
MRFLFIIVSAILFGSLQLQGDLSTYEGLSICCFLFFFLSFLYDLGKKVVILDLTILMACLTCLLMPVIFYHVYTKDNALARIWIKYMSISSDDYFSFALPGTLALALGIKFPLIKLKYDHTPGAYLANVRAYLTRHPNLGLYLVGIGLGAGMLAFLTPTGLHEVFFLMAHLIFVGVFYVIYSPNKRKRYIVPGVILLMFVESAATGMFGELVFILACSMILVMMGKVISFPRKLLFAVSGIFVIILIQSVKGEYRTKAWHGEGGSDPLYLAELFGDRITDPSTIFDRKISFVMAVRFNQGWLVAETMRLVPSKFTFGNGEPLLEAVEASVIPRFIWPDKPEAGGKANLKRFWGFNLVGFSTNIGTLGEAYANFDRIGGIIYLFFYGLFFNLGLSLILRRAEKWPTLILWVPFLFFTAISVETDLLSTMGALVKSAIFTYVVFAFFNRILSMKL